MSESGRSDAPTVTPERRWGVGGLPLPVRKLTVRGCRSSSLPLDFSGYMRKLCDDVKLRTPTFTHLDSSAMAFTYTTSRTPGKYGLLARVTPLRFRDGGVFHRHRGSLYQAQRYYLDGQELLYLVTFCLPRFLDLPFEEKLVTVIHELFHISPRFDGDVRRHDGRYQYHSHSKRGYDDLMGKMTRAYLSDHPEPGLFTPLHATFAELCAAHGGVLATRLPRPRMVRVT